jgi:hypothetical protein
VRGNAVDNFFYGVKKPPFFLSSFLMAPTPFVKAVSGFRARAAGPEYIRI